MARRSNGLPKPVMILGSLVLIGILGFSFKDNLPVIERLFSGQSGDDHELEWKIYQESVEAVKTRIKKPHLARFKSRGDAVKDVTYLADEGVYVVDSWGEFPNHFGALNETRFRCRVAVYSGNPVVESVKTF